MDLEANLHSLPPPDEETPDLECAICFSQFNNVFRMPKMLQCKHTFCLECLARMNVKSAKPDTIQCPLCRGFTPLPPLGLPKLDNNPTILSFLPEAMQRVYSVRFNRNKGQLQVKRTPDAVPRPSLGTISHTLDLGLPSNDSSSTPQGGIFLRLSNKPACRAFLMVVMVLLLFFLILFVIFKAR